MFQWSLYKWVTSVGKMMMNLNYKVLYLQLLNLLQNGFYSMKLNFVRKQCLIKMCSCKNYMTNKNICNSWWDNLTIKRIFIAATPAKWKVFRVICVAGSPILCAAKAPTQVPMSQGIESVQALTHGPIEQGIVKSVTTPTHGPVEHRLLKSDAVQMHTCTYGIARLVMIYNSDYQK